MEQTKQTNLLKYGEEYNFQSDDYSINGRGTQKKIYEETGMWNNRPKSISTTKERNEEFIYSEFIEKALKSISRKRISNANQEIAHYLLGHGIFFEQEFRIGNYIYDFKLGKYLLEINPYSTHNSSWGIFNNPKPQDYHRNKTLRALRNDYKCIHIFDWMDLDIIIPSILSKQLDIIDTGKPVRHIFDTKTMSLTNKENENTVIIYDDGFNIIC